MMKLYASKKGFRILYTQNTDNCVIIEKHNTDKSVTNWSVYKS